MSQYIPGLQKTLLKFFLLPVLLMLSMLLTSCEREVLERPAYMAALNDPAVGLMKERVVNGVRIRCKYLPPEFSAWREMRGREYHPDLYAELVREYAQSMTFALSLTPLDAAGDRGMAMRGVRNYEQFAARTAQLNFGMEPHLRLVGEDFDLHPVLASLDNSYELNKSRTILLVFAPEKDGQELLTGEELDVVWEDDIFETGIHHFVFEVSDITDAPLLQVGRSEQ